jgi:GntR family transcriptional regulator / MocR family aminotransferase
LLLQAQVRRAVVRAILGGRLTSGATVPTSRELAQLLSISRNTVTAAYAQLIDEGYLESRPRSGVFVAANARPQSAQSVEDLDVSSHKDDQSPAWNLRICRSLIDQRTLAKPERWREVTYPFVYGTYDPELFATEDFRECCTQSLARAHLPYWTPDLEIDDVPDLVEQIRERLLPKRGVFASKDEILITVGAQQALFLLAEALFDVATTIGLEEPGYPHARNCFSLRAENYYRSRSMTVGYVLTPCRQ